MCDIFTQNTGSRVVARDDNAQKMNLYYENGKSFGLFVFPEHPKNSGIFISSRE